MTTNTPPAWMIESAGEIYGEAYYDYRPSVTDIARIIAAHAPDAEALAEALNFQLDAINEMLDEYSWNEKFMALTMAHARMCNMRDDIESSLAAYRAKNPKQESK